jgi:uncharacterized protein (TIGR02996 family)
MNPKLLGAIRAAPLDDAARLAFADDLREKGDVEWAELIAVQVELAAGSWACPGFMHACGEHLGLAEMADRGCAVCRPWAILRKRELALIYRNRVRLLRTVDRRLVGDYADNHTFVVHGELVRGLVDRLKLPHDLFVEVARSVFARAPVTAVEITDRRPMVSTTYRPNRWGWFDARGRLAYALDDYHLHADIYARLPGGEKDHDPGLDTRVTYYPEETTAREALARACLEFGRTEAMKIV